MADQLSILLQRFLGKKDLQGHRHHGPGGNPVPKAPLGLRIQEGRENLDAGFLHRVALVGQFDEGKCIKMLDIPPVGVFSLLVPLQIPVGHIHGNLIAVCIDLGKHIKGRAAHLPIASVEVITVKPL